MTEDLIALIGIPGAIVAIPVLVAHLKPLVRPVLVRLGVFDDADPPWPFLADVLGVLWAFALHLGGQLDLAPALVLLVGLALGVAASRGRDQVVRLAGIDARAAEA